MFDFTDKLIVVTGAAQGIGAAVVRSLIQAGATVIGLDIQPEKLESLRIELASPQFEPYTVDVSNSLAVEKIVDHVEKNIGLIAGLVNVAGILVPKSVASLTDEDWARTFAVNTTGVFNVSRSVARAMTPRKNGVIVTVGSNAASMPRQEMSAYAASKAAATHFTRCLGLELASFGIRCNVISPGSTDTPMQHMLWTDAASKDAVVKGSLNTFRTGIPLGKIASPKDIAGGVLFLLSEQACHITMHDLRVDGGATLGA